MFRVIFIGGFDMNGNEQEVTTVSDQVHSASRMKVKKIAFIGLMGAVSAVLMLMCLCDSRFHSCRHFFHLICLV